MKLTEDNILIHSFFASIVVVFRYLHEHGIVILQPKQKQPIHQAKIVRFLANIYIFTLEQYTIAYSYLFASEHDLNSLITQVESYYMMFSHSLFALLCALYYITDLSQFELIIFNLAMNSRSRRQCCIYAKSQILAAFQTSNQRLMQKYQQSSRMICDEGIRLVQKMTYDYMREKDSILSIPPTFQMQYNENVQINHPKFKKQFIEPYFDNNQEEESNITFEKRQSKANQLHSLKKIKKNSTQQIEESIKKMDLDQHFYHDQQGQNINQENKDITNIEDYANKSITELINESSKKLQQKIAERRMKNEQSSDSSYIITDHSSNSSSNDNVYIEQFKQEADQAARQSSRINNRFSQRVSSQSTNSQSFQPMKIMYSPKKSKSKAKRLYIRDKRIPRWAQDLQKINHKVKQQRRDPRYDPNSIYGFCLVERLDTNVMFNGEQKYYRGSSAKWSKGPFSPFIS